MGQYSKKGLYSGYDKNHKEREALDYYATPTKEVVNILETIGLDLKGKYVLEPCCGGGHMVEGILQYEPKAKVIATDVQGRENHFAAEHMSKYGVVYRHGEDWDFLSENYACNGVDYTIMNPPFSLLIPFVQHAVDITKTGVLMLGKLQFLETQSRYNEIFKTMPPSDIYGYIDRIACYKGGNFSIKPSSIEAYAWYYFDVEKIKSGESYDTKYHWLWSKKT